MHNFCIAHSYNSTQSYTYSLAELAQVLHQVGMAVARVAVVTVVAREKAVARVVEEMVEEMVEEEMVAVTAGPETLCTGL